MRRLARQRAEVVRHAFTEYHAGRIALADLVRCLVEFRSTPPPHDGG